MLVFLCASPDAGAQQPQGLSASAPDQWQMTLDTIQSRAQVLMGRNNQLQLENRQLADQVQKLQQSITLQQNKNDRMGQFLKQRRGRTDQQMRMDELAQGIQADKQQLRSLDDQLRDLKRQQAGLGTEVEQITKTAPQDGDALAPWRKQLEDEDGREAVLENQLQSLKSITANPAETEAQRLQQLQKRKQQLAADISSYASRLDELRQEALAALSWQVRKKRLVHQLVVADAFNNRMRAQIRVLQEDIQILKDKVSQLESGMDAGQGVDLFTQP